MEDDLPEEFQALRQQYNGLTYPGDLAGDLGMVPVRTKMKREQGALRMAWTATRWIGLTAAAAAVALVTIGVWHAVTQTQAPLASVPASQPAHVAVAVKPPADAGRADSTPQKITEKETATAPNTAVAQSTPKAGSASATDDSIPLWSEIDVDSTDTTSTTTNTSDTYSTVAAGLPSQSLIMPTWSELQAESSTAQRGSAEPSKS